MLNYKLLQQWYYVIYTSLDSTVRCYLNNGLCFPIIPEEVPFQNIIKENSIFFYTILQFIQLKWYQLRNMGIINYF